MITKAKVGRTTIATPLIDVMHTNLNHTILMMDTNDMQFIPAYLLFYFYLLKLTTLNYRYVISDQTKKI